MLSGKIHRATVTGADVNYVDSVTVDHDLLEAADILPGEQVDVVDVTNGARLTTYVIPGERGKGEVKLNGAAAHLVSVGHLVIIMCYSQMDTDRARGFTPKVVFVDADNRILDTATDPGQVPENDLGLYASGIPFDHAH